MNKKIIYLLFTISIFFGIAAAQYAQEPSVTITADMTEGQAPLTVKFDAVITDPFGGKYPVTIDWVFGDNTASTRKNPDHTFIDAGTYTVACKVTFWSSPKKTAAGSVEIVVMGNTPVCTAPSNQYEPRIVSDGAGGAVITWRDYRSGNEDVYAQGVLANGTVKWTPGGIPVCKAKNQQYSPQITSDGAGGAIITWQDYRNRNYDIYTQGVLANGTLKWASDGVPVCTVDNQQQSPQITSDGAGGAVIIWQDYRNENYDIYAQGVLANGTLKWASDGIPICTADSYQQSPQIISDGAGGAVITWLDNRSGNYDIYIQGVLANGKLKWASDGVPVCMADNQQQSPQITSDGAGGAVIAWQDYRSGNADVYAQRINSEGVVQWASDGIPVCTADSHQYNPRLCPDGSGGVVITWQDFRSGSYDIYAQRINSKGEIQWASNGIAVCSSDNNQDNPQITSDGDGGAVITWQDYRNGYYDIYAQRINSEGVIQWTSGGIPLCADEYQQQSPQITSDGSGGTVITWQDYRSENNSNIYSQHIDKEGKLRVDSNYEK